ncbi:WD-40 repeat-containing protein [Tolypothrix sp. NIES-4075]|uniref:nSTAND1 domain-containing NTPase n=1 Tax=Tolypothrix sp. NIES-4075 TaxID=2005459 RepID=UPI000B5CB4A9|nr:caspase family protein [Tolypothrix sp. NIES-4075]GAX39609.1 WD-40 repeat-containing protein [Tolypothrix sp. NIES-4075]
MEEIKRSLAVVIGINEYGNGIPALKTAVNDAEQIAATLTSKYEYQVLLLLDSDANSDKFKSLLTALEQQKLPSSDNSQIQIQETDRVLFYFAGHGIALDALDSADGPTGFLVPQDARMDNDSSLLPMKRLHDALIKLPCRHILIILDCCFAGAFRWAGNRDAVRQNKVYRERYDRFISSCAQQVITSAGDDEKAADSLYRFGQRNEDSKNSPFAELLLKALCGEADFSKDGVITATEIYVYIHGELGKTSVKQTPGFCQLIRHDKGEYIFPVPGFDPNKLAPAPALDENTNPYRGLKSYEEKDSNLFFGRKALIEKLQAFIINQPLTVVLGASGSGKSSLVKAGLITQLKQGRGGEGARFPRTMPDAQLPITDAQLPIPNSQEWRILAPIRPGESPFKALNNALAQEKVLTFVQPQQDLEEELQTLSQNIKAWTEAHKNAKLLLVIDQFEELITLTRNENERLKFLSGLARAISAFPEQLRIVVTLRNDFEPQFRDTPLEAYWTAARFIVPAMSRLELRDCIVEPATARVMFFDPPTLVDQIIDEVAQMPGALPLLSFTLSELYLKYIKSAREGKRNNRAITQADYEELGGVTRSLTQRADYEYDELIKLDSAYAQTIKHVMLRMVAIGAGDLARRQVLLSELEYPKAENTRVKLVIERFLAARLLVSGQDTEGNSYVEPAHDVLVRGWQKLLTWKDQELGSLLLQRELTPTANKWTSQRRDKQAVGLLWNNDPRLPLVKQISESDKSWLNSIELEFVQRSITRRRNNRRRTVGIVSGVIASLTGLTIFALVQLQLSLLREKAAVAENRLLISPVDGLVLAIQTAGQNRSLLPWDILNPVKSSLLHAVQATKERDQLTGHSDRVTSVAFSPSGRYIVSGSADNTVLLWDMSGKPIGKPFTGHAKPITSVAFSPDGRYIVSGSEDNTVRLWDMSGKQIGQPFIGHTKPIQSVAFSPSGRNIVSGSEDNTLRLWDISGKAIGKPFVGHTKPVWSVAFSRDGKYIVSGSIDKTVRLWDISGNPVGKPFAGHTNAVWSVAFSPDKRYIVSGSEDRTIRLWDISGKPVGQPFRGHKGAVLSVGFSPDGQYILSAGFDRIVRLWDISGNLIGEPLKGHKNPVSSVAFSPDGRYIVSGSGDRTIRLWDISNKIGQPFLGHTEAVTSVAFSPDGKYIVSGSQDKTLRLWDISGKPVGQPFLGHKNPVTSVAFSPSGRYILSGSEDNTLRLWDMSGKPVGQPFTGHTGKVNSVAFSPSGRYIVSGSEDKTIRLWDIKGKPIGQPFIGHTKPIFSVAFSPNSQMIASSGDDKMVRLWDIKGKPIGQPFQGHDGSIPSVAFSPNGRYILTGSYDRTMQLWDISGKPIGKPFVGHEYGVTSAAISHDGQYIVSGSVDNSVLLWNFSNSNIGQKFQGHTNNVTSVAISPDGRYIVSGSRDKTIRLWQTRWEDWLEVACNNLQNHPVFQNPQTDEAKGAKDTCEKYVWHKK